jgi:iron-sulfur cluster assembly protein
LVRKDGKRVMIELTDKAISHIMNNMRYPGEMIRVGVKPAGCAGFEYVIDWTKNYDETDTVCDFGKFKILIDDMSAEYIKGSTLDVIQEGINTTVKLINPQEINSCGCGASVQF